MRAGVYSVAGRAPAVSRFVSSLSMSSSLTDFVLRPFRVVSGAVRRHRDGRAAQSAAALALALLFALVPLVVLARQLTAWLPDALQFGAPLQAYLTGTLLPDEAGSSVVRHASRFVAKARRLSLADLLLLLGSAWVWVRTADHALNAMWSQRPHRKVRRTALIYLALPVLAPVALGVGAGLTLYLVTASLGLVDEPPWLKVLLLRAAAGVVTAGFLVLLYRTLPRAAVSWGEAICGALVATGLLSLMQKGLSIYAGHMPAYAVVYGALATLPVFLMWLYLFWAIVLFGAALTAELNDRAR